MHSLRSWGIYFAFTLLCLEGKMIICARLRLVKIFFLGGLIKCLDHDYPHITTILPPSTINVPKSARQKIQTRISLVKGCVISEHSDHHSLKRSVHRATFHEASLLLPCVPANKKCFLWNKNCSRAKISSNGTKNVTELILRLSCS